MDPFCAKVMNPYKDDSVLMPDFHSPYSMVSGSIDQKSTPVAPLPKPIRTKIYNNVLRSIDWIVIKR